LRLKKTYLSFKKERNVELQELVINKHEMLEASTKESSLVIVTLEEMNGELSHAKSYIVDLVNAKDALETNLSCFKVQNVTPKIHQLK
jgi:hypothetical protein